MSTRSAPRYLGIAMAILVSGLVSAAQNEKTTSPDPSTSAEVSPYQQAVNDYVTAATKEIDAYGQKIQTATKTDANRALYSDAKSQLDECSQLLIQLKSADSTRFDTLKAEFEKARGKLVDSVAAAEHP